MSPRNVDPAQRRAELGAAILFLVTAAASIAGEAALSPLLSGPGILTRVAAQPLVLVWGAFGWAVNNLGIVFIAVFVRPYLNRFDAGAATAYLTVRIIEGTVMMGGVGCLLALAPLSREFVQAGSPVGSWFDTVAGLLKEGKLLGLTLLSLPLLGLGGLVFTVTLVRQRLVPALIAWTGVVGYALVLVFGLAGWFGLLDVSPGGSGLGSLLAIPVALFEIVLLPFWLFFKGFRPVPDPAD